MYLGKSYHISISPGNFVSSSCIWGFAYFQCKPDMIRVKGPSCWRQVYRSFEDQSFLPVQCRHLPVHPVDGMRIVDSHPESVLLACLIDSSIGSRWMASGRNVVITNFWMVHGEPVMVLRHGNNVLHPCFLCQFYPLVGIKTNRVEGLAHPGIRPVEYARNTWPTRQELPDFHVFPTQFSPFPDTPSLE